MKELNFSSFSLNGNWIFDEQCAWESPKLLYLNEESQVQRTPNGDSREHNEESHQ